MFLTIAKETMWRLNIYLGNYIGEEEGVAGDDDTRRVTSGVYGISRNPAFVGFDLTYTGLRLCFANWLHLVVVICTIVAFHFRNPSGGTIPPFEKGHRLQATITVSEGMMPARRRLGL